MTRCSALLNSQRRCRQTAEPGSRYCAEHAVPAYFFPNSVFLDIDSDDPECVCQALELVKMIKTDEEVDQILQSGLLEKIVACTDSTHAKIKDTALWCLVNFCSLSEPKGSKACIEHGLVPKLVRILMTEVNMNGAWCLANIASTDETIGRSVCSEFLTYAPLIAVLRNQGLTSLTRSTYAYLLESMAPAMNNAELEQLMCALGELPLECLEVDPDVRRSLLKVVKICSSIYPDLFKIPTEFLLNALESEDMTAIITLGNLMASENKSLIHKYLEAGILQILKRLLENAEAPHGKEILWMLSNIACEIEGAKRIIECYGLIDLIQQRKGVSIKDALWTLTNLAKTTTIEGAHFLVSCDVLTTFVNSISYTNVLNSNLALQGIVHIVEKLGHRAFALLPVQGIFLLQTITEDAGVRSLCNKLCEAHTAYRQLLLTQTVRSAYQLVERHLPSLFSLSVVNTLSSRLVKTERWYNVAEALTDADKLYLTGIGYIFDDEGRISLCDREWERFVGKN